MNDYGLVSIIVPTYNAACFIRETIDSVLAQTCKNWELLVIDDCSKDETVHIVESYVAKDVRIKLLKTEKASGSPARPRNIGINKACGRYIAFLDSDDYWTPDKLEKQLPLFEDPSVAIAYSYYEKVAEDGTCANRLIKSAARHTYKSLLYGNEIGCLTAVHDTRTAGRSYFQYIGHEDYALWLSILKKGYTARCVPERLAYYRVRHASVSSNKLRVIPWVWNIYRQQERIPFLPSVFYLCSDLIKSYFKYVK